MIINEPEYLNLSVVLIADPIDISKISIDILKDKVSFDVISYITKEAILLGSAKKKLKVTLASNRFEFIDENRTPFQKRETDYLIDTLNYLSTTLSIKAIGINLFENVILDGIDNASKYIVDNFLKDREGIEEKIGKQVFSHSIRLFFGEMNEYFDLRINPVELQSNVFNIQFHYHNDVSIVDTEKLIQQVDEKRKLTIKELPKTIKKVFNI